MFKFFKNMIGKKPSISHALCVDASCIGNPGVMEYRGVDLTTNKEIFHSPLYPRGTNNLGEFLAIYDAIRYIEKNKSSYDCIYSDSMTAIYRMKSKKIKTTLAHTAETKQLLEKIQEAVTRLKTHSISIPIYKRETKLRGEVPADFDRK